MRLLLIRHGESVDNVAGLYAGSRDSTLTNHGVLQAKRLGAHVASRRSEIGHIAHVFASDLQRAHQTAEAIVEGCNADRDEATTSAPLLTVTNVPELREKDFGSREGAKFGTKDALGDDGSAESPAAMLVRIRRFLDAYLGPIIEEPLKDARENTEYYTVVIVSHGIILNVLLRELLARYPLTSSNLGSPVAADRMLMGSSGGLHAPWSNTGVLQILLRADDEKQSFCATVEMTNNLDHLKGLKKTRGGIGSAQFDSRQRTMDSFFASGSRKRKADGDV